MAWFERKSALWLPAAATALAIGTHLAGHALGWKWNGTDWQAVWTFFTFLVAAIAASVALAQLKAHHLSQRELSRPYVIVDFAFRSFLLMIEIKNIGKTPAHNVKLAWEQQPVALDPKREATIRRRLVDGQIPYLAPGRSIRYFVGRVPDYLEREDAPRRLAVTATYDGGKDQIYGDGEKMILDLDQWAESLADTDYENKNWNESQRQTKALGKIADGLDGAEAALAALLDTATVALTHTPWAAVGSATWVFLPQIGAMRFIINTGREIAHDVRVEDATDSERGRSAFHVDDDLPRSVRPREPIRVSMLRTLGSPLISEVRISWSENGEAKHEILRIW